MAKNNSVVSIIRVAYEVAESPGEQRLA